MSLIVQLTHRLDGVLVLVSIHRSVTSLSWTVASLVGIVSEVLVPWSWAVALVLLVLLPEVV